MNLRRLLPPLLSLVLVLGAPTSAAAQDAAVAFEHDQPTAWGESVYLLGDLPTLGAGDPTRALRMVPDGRGRWRLEVALPPGASYRYTYLLRHNDPRRAGERANARRVAPILGTLAPGAPPAPTRARLTYYSGWRGGWARVHDADATREVPLRDAGPGRHPGERRWTADLPRADGEVAFDLHDGAGDGDRPAGGDLYRTGFSACTLADGQLYQGDRAPGELAARPGGRLERVARFPSTNLGNARPVWVYLPRGYDRAARRYPVAYVHDGQNLFDPGALFGGWRLDETLDRLIAAGRLPEVIVVGVGNTRRRMDEYAPDPDGGQASRYGAFLSDELKPWVDAAYRTRAGPEHTALVGSSLGGIASLYLGWTRPEVFGRVASLSGSYWLRSWIERPGPAPPGLRVWLDSGDQGPTADGLEGTLFARDQLLRRGFVLGDDLAHTVARGGRHDEASWRQRVGDALRYLFGP